MNNLLGDHNHVVDAILNRLEDIKNGDTDAPRVLVLTGESGIGKSRIVREVYEELRRKQPAPGYWPSMLPDSHKDDNSIDPMASRKVLGPDPTSFEWHSQALPSFGWWHFECEIMESQNAVNVVGAAYPQLRAHLLPLGLAWNDQAGFSDKLGRAREKVIEEVRSTVTDGGFEALGAFGLAFPGLGTLIRWAGQAGNKIAKDRQHRKQLDSDVAPASESHVSVAQELAAAIRSTALTASPGKPGLPQIVVIEDMHRMGDDLAELLTELGRPDKKHPVLVIGTAWPEGYNNPGYKNWAAQAMDEGRAAPMMVKQLEGGDLITLLRHYAKNTDEDTAKRVVERMPNPHFLKLWLTMRSTMRLIASHDQALVLSEDELMSLPLEVMDVLRQRWLELPEEVQQALILAVIARAKASDSGPTALPRFLPDVVAKASKAAGFSFQDLEAGFSSAVSPGAWCNTDANAQWLRETDLQEVVLSYTRDSRLGLLDSEHKKLQKETRDVLIEWIDERREGIELQLEPDLVVAAEWLDSLPPAEGAAWTDADTAAQWALAETANWNYDLAAAVEKARIVLDRGMLDSDTNQKVRTRLALWVGASGRYGEALELYRALLGDQLQTLSPEDPAVLATRHHLALNLFNTGRKVEALVEEELVWADRRKVLGAEHPDTLIAQNNVACWYAETGRVAEAVEQLQEVLMMESRVLGPDAPGTLLTRRNLVAYRRRAGVGSSEEVINDYENLLLDQTRVLGADDDDTLGTRNSLACEYAEAGNLAIAVEQLEVLAQDSIEAIGSMHPLALVIRSNLARFLGEAGQLGESLQQYRQLLIDAQAAAREDNPDTLIIEASLGKTLFKAGQSEEAVTRYKGLVKKSIGLFGIGDEVTLGRINTLGCFLALTGDLNGGKQYLHTALVGRTRLLGDDHEDTVKTRNNFESVERRAGVLNW